MRISSCVSLLSLLFVAPALSSCAQDFTAATADVIFVSADATTEGEGARGVAPLPDPGDPGVEPPVEEPPRVEDPTPPVEEPPVEEPPVEEPPVEEPPVEPPPVDEPPADPGPDYDPDWTDHEDDGVQGCLETFPAICNKVDECGGAGMGQILAGGCVLLFDAMSDQLTTSCEDIHTALEEALPGADIPLVGDLGTLISNLITGCVENFSCEPGYLEELGAKFQQVIDAAGSGGDIMAALPALLEFAQMCGGLDILPF